MIYLVMMMSRVDTIQNGVALWCGYYRENPHRFAHDYLHLNLHLFQKMLLCMMNWANTSVFIGSRGIGKTFLSAVFCVIRCILWPGSKIIIASGTRGQAQTGNVHSNMFVYKLIELLECPKTTYATA